MSRARIARRLACGSSTRACGRTAAHVRRGLWARTEPRPCGVGCGRGRSLARAAWAAGEDGASPVRRVVVGHRVGGARSPRGRCAVTAWAVRGHLAGGARSPRGRSAVTAWAVRGHLAGGARSPRGHCCDSVRRECCVPPMEPRASASGSVGGGTCGLHLADGRLRGGWRRPAYARPRAGLAGRTCPTMAAENLRHYY